MTVYKAFCESCAAVHPHAADLGLIACKRCGLAREVDAELLAAVMAFAGQPPVQDMRDCGWCKEKLPADHDCPAGAVGCTTRQPDETPCGECTACYAAQREDPTRYGRPSDIDTP